MAFFEQELKAWGSYLEHLGDTPHLCSGVHLVSWLSVDCFAGSHVPIDSRGCREEVLEGLLMLF